MENTTKQQPQPAQQHPPQPKNGDTRPSKQQGIGFEILVNGKWVPMIEPDAVLVSAKRLNVLLNACESSIRAGLFNQAPMDQLGLVINTVLYLRDSITVKIDAVEDGG
jgi:hypothetical protein